MTAPSPFCSVHPFGTTTMCGPCRDRRRSSDIKTQEQHWERAMLEYYARTRNARPLLADGLTAAEKTYESFIEGYWRGRPADGHLPRRDDDQSVARSVGDVRLTVTDEGDEEAGDSLGVVGVDSAHALVQVVDPQVIRVGRVEVENGSVVVQLDSHGRKRIARRVLTAAAVAAVALWAVAS